MCSDFYLCAARKSSPYSTTHHDIPATMKPPFFPAAAYYFTVFCTGAAVLIFEVAAVRLFAPYFGSSLYVLSSVLTVILLALSVGYFFGGRLADRLPTYVPLYLIIMSAGVIMLLLLNIAQYVLPATQGALSLMTGPLLMAMLLFFVPALFLGMDSPYIIKLLAKDASSDCSGAIVGSAFFWSTIGSIVGSLAAGFVLIPSVGLLNTIGLVSLGLIIVGAGMLCFLTLRTQPKERKITRQNLIIIIIAFITLGSFLYYNSQQTDLSDPAITTLYQTDGFYSNIHVYEQVFNVPNHSILGSDPSYTFRFLKRDTNHSSAIIPGSTKAVFNYVQLADTYPTMNPDASSYLVLGGGAYSIPRQIYHFDDTMQISVVEIEPKLLDIAREYFELPDDSRITSYEQDARLFLQNTTNKYDVIYLDVFNSGHYIPPHLATVEFFRELKKRLSPKGVVYINSIGTLDTSEETLMGSLAATISHVFPNHQIITLGGRDNPSVQNIVHVVRHDDQPIVLPSDKIIVDYFHGKTHILDSLIIDSANLDYTKQHRFTDNQSNIERLIVRQFAGR
jgi:predicted membrane-bound spermidine synthase